jgi:hypothetical protein
MSLLRPRRAEASLFLDNPTDIGDTPTWRAADASPAA